MTDLDLMKSQEATYEVAGAQGVTRVAQTITCEVRMSGGNRFIHINDGETEVALTGPEAKAVSDFILANVRKRW